MKRSIALTLAAAALSSGCASDNSKKPTVERGPGGTIAYSVQVEASHPGVKIEAGGEYVGTAPLTLKIFGDKDGTFHNFGSYSYVVRALPAEPGQYAQEKNLPHGRLVHTGGSDSKPDLLRDELETGWDWQPQSCA